MNERITTGTRLKQIMNERNIKQVDILRMTEPLQKELGIKIGKSALSQYVSDKSSPDQHKLFLLSKTLDVSEAWLMGYDVPKERISDAEKSNEDDILTIYNKLEPPLQKIVYDKAVEQLHEQESTI